MNKQAAAVLALGLAGATITCLFAYMCYLLNGPAWGIASLISAFTTLGGLLKAASEPKAAGKTES